jgi:outer membrane protein assembly factor BamA
VNKLVFILAILFPQLVLAQDFALKIIATDNNPVLEKIKYQKDFKTEALREQEINKLITLLFDNAYLEASTDSVSIVSNTKTVFIHIGNQYKWANLAKGNIADEILGNIGYRDKMYAQKQLNYKEVTKLHQRILIWCENNGYPFASVKLDSIKYENQSTLSAVLNLKKNKLIKIDSIIIKGKVNVSEAVIYRQIGISPGDLYNEQKVKSIAKRIRELTFIKESKPFTIEFTDKQTKIILNLEKKKASMFDGIIGLLPDKNTSKPIITGDVKLKLMNVASFGELFSLNWRRLQSNTQDLQTQLNVPFLFRTAFGADVYFKLYRKDTTFLEVNPDVGIQYQLQGGNFFKVFVNRKQTNLLSTKGLEFITVLPPFADITTNLYGLGFKSEKLDYRLNPRKGFSFTVKAAAGTRQIKKNSGINDAVYNNLQLNTTQYSGQLNAEFYLPIFKRAVIKTAVNSAWVYSPSLFRNELFRIGGLKILRGFDEESIFASTYAVSTLEYRYLLEQNSYLYLFTDVCFYESNAVNQYVKDIPYSVGAGISFETKAGIFTINYALGSQKNNPIDFRSGKIHFGIVGLF